MGNCLERWAGGSLFRVFKELGVAICLLDTVCGDRQVCGFGLLVVELWILRGVHDLFATQSRPAYMLIWTCSTNPHEIS